MADYIGTDAGETIVGGAGDDRITGRGGDDTLTGGDGNDVFVYDTREFGVDTITDFNTNGDRIDLSYLHVADLASLRPFMTQDGADVVIDFTVGDFGFYQESIRLKNVTLGSLSNADFVFNTSPAGLVVTGAGVLFGGNGNDLVSGNDGRDSLVGGAGDDRLIGYMGEDWLMGGAGNDVFGYTQRVFGYDTIADFNTNGDRIDLSSLHVADIASLLPFMAQDGNDVIITLGYHFSATIRVPNVSLGSLSNADFILDTSTTPLIVNGTTSDYEVLFGGAGNDTIIGGHGRDSMAGGPGNDVFVYDRRGFGTDTIVDFDTNGDRIDLSFFNVDDFSRLLPFMVQKGADVVITLGYGNYGPFSDTEVIRIKNVALGSLSNADFIFKTSTAALTIHGTYDNDVLFGGAGNDTIFGDSGDDRIDGGAGDDTISAFGGADRIDGGEGSDTVSYNASWAGVTVDLFTGTASGGDDPSDSLTSIENVFGSKRDDVIIGNAGANALAGNEGSDLLRGGAGADILDGGAGFDTASYSDSTKGITVNLATGKGSGGTAHGDTLLSIEVVNGSAYADTLIGSSTADSLRGGAGDDVLHGGAGVDRLGGGAGDDVLHGGAGADTLDGGAGDDVLLGDAGADTLDGGDGFDLVTYFDSTKAVAVDLAAFGYDGSGGTATGDTLISIEEVRGSAYADTLIGSIAANILRGGAGDDLLGGGAGADTLDGGAGFDTADYSDSTKGVTVSLAGGVTSGFGSSGTASGDTLISIEAVNGSDYADILKGSNVADTLIGGGGKDTLTGGNGADRFVFATRSDSVVGANADRITDFSQAQGDKIDLSAIDANLAATGNQSFSFIGSGLFTHRAGELRFAISGGVTTVTGDVGGDGIPDFEIVLDSTVSLQKSDFTL